MLFAGEPFGPGETSRIVALMATVAQIGAAVAGVVYGFILAYNDRFQTIWTACALVESVQLAMFAPFFRQRASSEHARLVKELRHILILPLFPKRSPSRRGDSRAASRHPRPLA